MLIKKLRSLLALLRNIRVEHLLYLWFFSVLGFLIVVFAFGYAFKLDDAWSGKNILFLSSLYGFMILGVLSFCLALMLIAVNIFIRPRLNKVVKLILLLIIMVITGAAAYQMGTSKGKTSVICEFSSDDARRACKGDDSSQQEEGLFECPYKIEGGAYTEYATLANEVMVAGKPQLIENPEIVKMSEPFNLVEFEKDLYKLSTDKGWDERKFDVDDDGKKERIISANVAMNHTPHIALILKDGRVVFRAEGANVWIEDDYKGRGFTLHKTIDWNIGESETVRYLPKDGGFMPVWKQKACWVHFE